MSRYEEKTHEKHNQAMESDRTCGRVCENITRVRWLGCTDDMHRWHVFAEGLTDVSSRAKEEKNGP